MAAAEAAKIVDIIENSSIVPEGPNQIYHIVGIKWYNSWLKYTSQAASEEAGSHPGPMNGKREFTEMLDQKLMNESIMYPRDIANNYHIKTSLKEEVNYKTIPHEAWKMLNLRYGNDSLFEEIEDKI
jgi:hypothetical protein